MERLQNYLTWSTIWAKRRFKQSLSCINDLHGWILSIVMSNVNLYFLVNIVLPLVASEALWQWVTKRPLGDEDFLRNHIVFWGNGGGGGEENCRHQQSIKRDHRKLISSSLQEKGMIRILQWLMAHILNECAVLFNLVNTNEQSI